MPCLDTDYNAVSTEVTMHYPHLVVQPPSPIMTRTLLLLKAQDLAGGQP